MPAAVQRQYVTIYAGDGISSKAASIVIIVVHSMTVLGSAAVPLATLIVEPGGQARGRLTPLTVAPMRKGVDATASQM